MVQCMHYAYRVLSKQTALEGSLRVVRGIIKVAVAGKAVTHGSWQ